MQYYSTDLKQFFDTPEACEEAEAKYKQEVTEANAKKEALRAERKARADEVNAAYKAVKEAEKAYYELRNQFVRDYGSFHATYSDFDAQPFASLFDLLF